MTAKIVQLPDGRVWLRVARRDWDDPLDASYARHSGGRWNPPESFPALYLNGDVTTAQMQVERMLEGYPATIDDLDDGEYVLVAATLPAAQRCADATTAEGLRALGLPETYPLDAGGDEVEHTSCALAGQRIRDDGLDGVWCRSACTADGRGRELAWFGAGDHAAARPVWPEPLAFGVWRDAAGWHDLGLRDQLDPIAEVD